MRTLVLFISFSKRNTLWAFEILNAHSLHFRKSCAILHVTNFLKGEQMETFINHQTIHQPQSIAQFSNASLVVVLLLKLR